MPITFTEEDFQSAPAQPKAGFFSEQDFAPRTKKTREQVAQEVNAAQGRMDMVNPPETQGMVGRIAGSNLANNVVSGLSLQPVMRGIGEVASIPLNHLANEIYGVRPQPFVINRDSGELTQAPGADPYFGAGKPMVNVPMAHPEQMQDVSALPRVLAQLVEGLTTPENVATLPLAAGKNVGGQLAATVFAPQMVTSGLQSAPEVVMGETPQAREEAAYNTVINLLLGGKIGKGLVDQYNARPITPEVMPPLQRPVAPISRQLNAPPLPFTEAEFATPPRLMAPGEAPTPVPSRVPSERPAGAARFGVDATGKAVDISQLTPKEQTELYRGPKEYVPREQYVRPGRGPVPIIGEGKMMENPLPNVVEPLVPFQNETRPFEKSFVPSKQPVEPSGGEVSFRAPAQAQGVPSARQSAVQPPVKIEPPKREVVFQNETAPEAAVVPAKPTVAKLSTSGNKNPLGDPMGSTYYATPEDWGAWQKVQTDFKDLLSKGAEFDGPEMMKVRQENENIKNRYGGMPPVEPKSGGIGGGIKGAVEKNKEAGSIPNPAQLFNDLKERLFSRETFKKIEPQNKTENYGERGSYLKLAHSGKEYLRADRGDLETALHETIHSFTHNNKDSIVALASANLDAQDKADLVKLVKNLGTRYRVHANALEQSLKTGKDNAGLWRSFDELTAQASNRKFWDSGSWTTETARRILSKVYGEEMTDFLAEGQVTKEQYYPKWNGTRFYINPIGPLAQQTAKDVATLGKKVKEVGTDFIRAYSEPLQEQMGRLGGPVGKMVSEEAGQIISRGKELYGELTPVIDPAKKQVGKMMREGTTWMRGRNEVTPYASFNNFFGVNEGATTTPLNAKRGMKLAADANLAIGKMAERANPGFKASGKLQRIPTTVGYDFIVNGGEGRQRWIEGVAKLNNKPVIEVQNFFDKMKETLGDPSSDAASLDRINQDFTRKFPRTITHIKTATGWHEVVVSDPFNYLEQAAQRTAHSVAFREVYPLIQHQGQWVQSGKLQATRKAIMKELDKGSDIVKFDNLVKALQGHPLDTFKGGATTAIGAVSGTIGSPLKALMLSANAPVNIGEVLSGGPSIFMGYTTMGKAVGKMLTDNTFYDQLELTGARNKAMYNLALDPSSPLRSLSRQVATGVRKITGQQFLNEIQETTAAASAKVYSDAIKGGKMGEYSLNRAKALFRAMGFNEGQATKMVKGDVELLKQFENRAASWLTTGNQATGEMSRLGASRLFNAAFWFHKYPQMTMNQFRSVGGNLVDDVKGYAKSPSKENWSPLYHNSVLMGRLLGGRSLQGAITLGILAGVSGGLYGIYQTMREAEEETLKFVGDSLVSGFGGPLSVMQRLNQNVKGGESFTKELVKLSAPASLNQELIDMGMGVGRYSGMGKMESIATFLEGKTPISRTIRMGLAVSGLSEKDLELEVAMKAFYKWRKEQPGFVPMGQMGGTDEQVEIRSGMQKVKKAIEAGEDWVAELKKVKETKGAGASLRAGTMLQVNGKPLDEEQMKSLEKRLGANGLEKIKLRDAMIREVGRELNAKTESGEKQAPGDIKKPTGKWAVDYETDSVRSERVMGRLEPGVREFLKKNEVEDVGYTPSLKRGVKKQELTMEQVKVLEDEYVVQLNNLVGNLAKNKNLSEQTPKLRKTLISNMLEGARKIAMAKSLGNIPQDPEQQRK